MAVTILIAQGCARWRRRAQPRHVPFIITSAVVLSCLAVLLLDWAFSQLYVRLDSSHLVPHADPADLYTDFSAEASAAEGYDGGGGEAALGGTEPGYAGEGGGGAAGHHEGNFAEYDAYYAASDAAAAGGGGEGVWGAELPAAADAGGYAEAYDAEDLDGDHEEL